MPSLNKKSKGGNAAGFRPWHPNFCNSAELPDIKTVRTKFFVNVGCVIAAAAALLHWAYIEYTIHGVAFEQHTVEQQISSQKTPSESAISRYKVFKEGEARVGELQHFLDGNRLILSDFFIDIGQTVPEHVVLSSIEMRSADATIRGVVESAPEEASAIASAYAKQLNDNKELSSRFASISLTSLSRDQVKNVLNFEIILKFNK